MKRCNGYEKAAFALLWLYLWVVFFFQGICVDAGFSLAFLALLGALSGASAAGVVWLSRKQWPFSAVQQTTHSARLAAAGTLLTCAFYLVYFLAQYPGGSTPDVWNQYQQAIGEAAYSDWHPVLHTLLFFTLPLKLGGSLGLIVFLQMLYFCLAFGYLLYVLCENGCPRAVLAFLCIYVWFHPILITYLAYPWKDLGMTIFGMLLMGQYIQVLCSRGEWLRRRRNLLAFAVVTVCCSYMRHNAILFTLPMVLLALFYGVRERKLRRWAAACIVVGMCLVKLLYAGLGVEKPGERVLETVGLPATIWCNVMQKSPDALPGEAQELLYRMASQEAYETCYQTGSFNSIKWSGQMDLTVVDAMSYAQVAKLTFQCFRYAPIPSMEALCKLTGLVYTLDNMGGGFMRAEIGDNPWGIHSANNPAANKFLRQVAQFGSSGAGTIFFGSIGLQMLCMLIAAMAALARGRSAFVHILPLFCYNFGTMLLLSGWDYRFFLPNLTLWVPVIWVIAQDTKKLPGQGGK